MFKLSTKTDYIKDLYTELVLWASQGARTVLKLTLRPIEQNLSGKINGLARD